MVHNFSKILSKLPLKYNHPQVKLTQKKMAFNFLSFKITENARLVLG